MIIARSVSKAIVVAISSVVAAGCAATQAPVFPRLSAAELQRTEQAACFDVPPSDRGGPFSHRDWVAGVEVVREKVYPKAPPQPVGVAVYLRAEPGVSQQWIGHLIECHRAHQAMMGEGVAEQGCPLLVDDARIDLSSTVTGYRVAITSKEIAVARSLIDRCQSIL